ncbi:hypothetical protein QYF36_011539 [Acer negundo]|nr:hypothetical protein QYF36_011539 [Acer negundo]
MTLSRHRRRLYGVDVVVGDQAKKAKCVDKEDSPARPRDPKRKPLRGTSSGRVAKETGEVMSERDTGMIPELPVVLRGSMLFLIMGCMLWRS